jgi:DNA-binding IclR family transcriptional regulator
VAVLRGLVDEIGETCNYTMLDGDAVLYVERVETSSPLRLHMEPGCRVPLHCTASGKLFLSQMPEDEARRLLGRAPYRRYTPRTLCDFASLSRELDRIRASGIGVDVGEYLEGSVCLAVPVLDARGRPCAALAVHGPAPRFTPRKANEHVPALRRAAASLAAISTRQTTHEETRP